MTVAVRGVVSLFRILERHQELDREILAFSISHDHTTVRIYGHYPFIEGKRITYWRHPIDNFSFTARDGKDKWTAYKFTKNIYDNWMPNHFKRLCSVINGLPDEIPTDIENELSQPSESQAGQSQDTGASSLQQHGSRSFSAADDDSQPSQAASQDVTPNTSFTQKPEPAFKKPRKGTRTSKDHCSSQLDRENYNYRELEPSKNSKEVAKDAYVFLIRKRIGMNANFSVFFIGKNSLKDCLFEVEEKWCFGNARMLRLAVSSLERLKKEYVVDMHRLDVAGPNDPACFNELVEMGRR